MRADAGGAALTAHVAEGIEQAILEGRFGPDERIPSYRELCRMYRVSLKTVRRAIDILDARGFLYRRERSGTFVSPSAATRGRVSTAGGLACVNFIEMDQPSHRAVLRSDYLAGYTDALEHLDVKVRFVTWDGRDGRHEAFVSSRVPLDRQGCVLVNVVPRDAMEWMRAREIPFVVQFFCYYPDWGLPPHHRVYVNKVGAAFAATQYLMGLGHRRIAFVGRPPTAGDLPGLYDGYRAALLCAGLGPGRDDMLDFLTDDVDLAIPPVSDYLRRPDLPSAVLAQTDALAMAVLQAASRLGIRVPEDLSVVGYNDLPGATATVPPLTTLASPRRLLGRTAVEILLRAAAERRPDRFETRILSPHLVVRNSTAAVRPGALIRDTEMPLEASEMA